MKNLFPRLHILSIGAIVCVIIAACTKTETVTVNIQEPVIKYSVLVSGMFAGQREPGTTTFIDSNFYFRNTSDSGANISYSWDFGDGTTSTEKNPIHSYRKRGVYTVSLTVDKDKRVQVKAQQQLIVKLGQQHLSDGDGTNLAPVAIQETGNNEFVLLASVNYGSEYRLYQLDTLMQQKSAKTFPASYRLNSMNATADGNYIFTGTTQVQEYTNEIIKTRADGSLLWSKIISANDHYSAAVPTADGGYVLVGTRRVDNQTGRPFNTVIIKTDGNGNTQWQKLLDNEGLLLANNAIVESDGIVIGGIKQGAWAEMDSIQIIKLNNSGAVVWQNAVYGGMNTFNWGDCRIAKMASGNYAVNNIATRGIFLFNSVGVFLDRKLAPGSVLLTAGTDARSVTVLQNLWSNGTQMRVSKIGLDGAQEWSTAPDGWQKMGASMSCCSSSWAVDLKPLRKGGTIAVGYRINNNAGFNGNHTAIVMMQLSEAGNPL